MFVVSDYYSVLSVTTPAHLE